MVKMSEILKAETRDWGALILRVGLGLVFVIGGANKLGQLLNAATHDGLVAKYTGAAGYINGFFLDFLFSGRFGDWLSPSAFLTALSSFELISGILLVVGLAVRPLSLIYAFLLWTFVMSLPVATTPGIAVDVSTYQSPAMLVQIRDIGLSGMMFVLFNLGAGIHSLDRRLGFEDTDREIAGWDNLGLLLRLSVGVIMIVGGAFAGGDHIQSFATSGWILLLLGVLLVSGHGVRLAGGAVIGVMLWYMAAKLDLDKSLIGNLNGIKREFAIMAAAGLLVWRGGGGRFTFVGLIRSVQGLFASR
ncbi:MAG: DoxX family protein [Sphingomonadales bacterium]